MKTLPLSRGLEAIVDDADFEWLSQWKWSAARQGRRNCTAPKFRAVRVVYDSGRPRTILMHRLIAGAGEGRVVDHINGNPLDNRRANLRIVSQYENCQNRRPDDGATFAAPRWNSSPQKGVTWNKRRQKWIVQVKRQYYGGFDTEAEAVSTARMVLEGQAI